MPGPHARRTDHPYLVTSVQDLPDGLRQLAEQGLAAKAETIFVMPAQTLPKNFESQGGMQRVSERALLFTAQGVTYVRGHTATEPGQVVSLSGEQLLYTRLIQILLYGRLEFCGVEDGALKCIVVEYNSVGHDLLHPALQRFLRLAWTEPSEAQQPDADETQALLQRLGEQSFKFRNGLRIYALQPGERLLGWVFQERVVQRFLGIFPRLAVPAALIAITHNEIILIEEGRTNATSYGWFVTFCPRRSVVSADISPDAQWHAVHVQLQRANAKASHQVTLESATAQAWQSLYARLTGSTQGHGL